MAIPKPYEITLPLLKILNDGTPRTRKETVKAVCEHFNLSEEERKQLKPSGGEALIGNRTGWAIFELKKAGLVEKLSDNTIKITDEGLKILEGNPTKIDRKFLMTTPTDSKYLNKLKEGNEEEDIISPSIDEKDEKFLRSINDAIPKYEKTQKRMQEFIDFYHNHPEIQEKIKAEKTKLDEAIKNLKITQALYTKEDSSSEQSDFAEEDYSKDDYQLIQTLDLIIQRVNKFYTSKSLWNLGKVLDSNDVAAMRDIESLEKNSDIYSEIHQLFTNWVIQSDIYISNSNFQKDSFLSRFIKQRNKTEREMGKEKINIVKLLTTVSELKTHVVALEQHGKRKKPKIPKSPKDKSLKTESQNTVRLEKGKKVDILKQVSKILNNSTKFIKIMDNWIGLRTLDYLTSIPDIPVMVLTSDIGKKRVEFETLLRRINEERSKPIEIRTCRPKDFHDRHIINGKELWMIGSSLKDAGYTNSTLLTEIKDKYQRDEINKTFDVLWKNSTPICL